MRRAFTKREKTLLLVLIILVLLIGYFKLVFEPINDGVDRYNAQRLNEQSQIDTNRLLLEKIRAMQQELDEIHASGTASPIPAFDNSVTLMRELHAILQDAGEYSLNFGDVSVMENGRIMMRPVQLAFTTATYSQMRSIFDAIHGSKNLNQISDVAFEYTESADTAAYKTKLTVTFFEIAK